MPHHTTPETSAALACPQLTRATFPLAVLRLAIATDAELAEWDTRLDAALEADQHQRATNGRTRCAA